MSPDLLIRIAAGMMALALLLATVRLLRGPTVPDRVVAFDLLTLHVLGLVCATAILTDQWLFLDAAIILALMTFMATLAFARYVERRAQNDAQEELRRRPEPTKGPQDTSSDADDPAWGEARP